MKKSKIEKHLRNELRQATPKAFDELWKRCEDEELQKEKEYLLQLEKVAVGVENDTHRKGGKRLLTTMVTLFVALAVALLGVWGALAGWFKDGAPSINKGYFILDVNPSVEVDYDEKGKVSEVVGLNADGRVLIYGIEEELVGQSYEKAVDVLFDRCVLLGYFSAASETNAVLVSASKHEGGSDTAMAENVRKLFANKFVDKKLRGVAIAGKDDPALADEAEKYGIDSQKLGLILDYLAQVEKLGVESEIDEDEYGEISIREIYEAIEELEELKIGHQASNSIGDVLERMEDVFEGTLAEEFVEELQDLIEVLQKAKTFDEISIIKVPLLAILERLEKMATGGDGDLVRAAREEIEKLLVGVETHKENLQKTTEDAFKEREEKYKDDFDKEAEEPEGGFEAWQDEKKEEFEKDWQGKKEDWKETLDKHFGGKNHE